MNQETILITGSAGFIGFHLAKRLLDEGTKVIGIDSIDAYYDTQLKLARNNILCKYPNYSFYQENICSFEKVDEIFSKHEISKVVNLAAQAGVRHSTINPFVYTQTNVNGFLNILEASKRHHIKHVVFASSSSVYGASTRIPFKESEPVDHPVSLYAATKKSNELIAHAYADNYKLPVTGLRFFTVYGPWGRPDMALFIFTKAMIENQPITLFNHGNMQRDFTYIDDIIESVVRLLDTIPKGEKSWDANQPMPHFSRAPYRIFNVGNSTAVQLADFVDVIEKELGIKAKKIEEPMQVGDVPATFADTSMLREVIGFQPQTPVKEGIKQFVRWYRDYYQV